MKLDWCDDVTHNKHNGITFVMISHILIEQSHFFIQCGHIWQTITTTSYQQQLLQYFWCRLESGPESASIGPVLSQHYLWLNQRRMTTSHQPYNYYEIHQYKIWDLWRGRRKEQPTFYYELSVSLHWSRQRHHSSRFVHIYPVNNQCSYRLCPQIQTFHDL